jgi:hypothetical protein
MADHDELMLDALLLILTDKQQVINNIQNLKIHKAEAIALLKTAEDAQAKADARHAEAKNIEDQNAALTGSLESREANVKKSEQHWLERNNQQIEDAKEFNEEKLQHAAKVRQLDIDRGQLESNTAALATREANIKKLEDQTKALNDEATKLRDEHKARVDKLINAAKEAAE